MNKKIFSLISLLVVILFLCCFSCNKRSRAGKRGKGETVQKTATKKPSIETQRKLQTARQGLAGVRKNLKAHLSKYRGSNQKIDLALRKLEDTYRDKEDFVNQKIKSLNPESAKLIASKIEMEKQFQELDKRIKQSSKSKKKELSPQKKELRQKLTEATKKRKKLIRQIKKDPKIRDYFKEFRKTIKRLEDELFKFAEEAGPKGYKLLKKSREIEQKVKELSS